SPSSLPVPLRSRRIAAIWTVQVPAGARCAQSFQERAASLYFLAANCSWARLSAIAGATPRGALARRLSFAGAVSAEDAGASEPPCAASSGSGGSEAASRGESGGSSWRAFTDAPGSDGCVAGRDDVDPGAAAPPARDEAARRDFEGV